MIKFKFFGRRTECVENLPLVDGGSAQSSTTPVTVRVLLDINFHHEGKGNSPLCHSTELTRRVDCGYSKGAKIEMSLLGRLSWGAFSLPVLVPPVQGLQGCLNLLSLVFSSDREGLAAVLRHGFRTTYQSRQNCLGWDCQRYAALR